MTGHMMVRNGLILAAVVAAGSTNALLAQDRAARLRDVYSPEAAAQIEAVVQEAGRNGIPMAPLYDKALEGAAKRVPAAQVMPALREYSGRMQRAQGLLGGAPRTAWVVAGADALRRGVAGRRPDVDRAGRGRPDPHGARRHGRSDGGRRPVGTGHGSHAGGTREDHRRGRAAGRTYGTSPTGA